LKEVWCNGSYLSVSIHAELWAFTIAAVIKAATPIASAEADRVFTM